ncbi:hypothetical protein FEQ05_06023 [Burkholderia pseudomultivorans]|uniref:Uncharacterized protein n=1 Tax=Burkholderia pseudomultivorans TaxID=1207504 RepID=A0ABU2EEQ4_9BURK|nr:hypothetical protein [Burkholderia pseudomultivorans]MDR8726097.1 hypothetical protein [Burkholderia pseudomultivorans]MDR8735007.1 hypothetical protein [Burkholderia pseudomultivorans]MDR8741172.1 hypothetical protein [Burkholderia pseudomultivorans]MDR8758059.1 hypothetical protein [Burkholderia pseudomultivorans]MDR8777387.1 hypothetical protein [Burkholderia pseudomultivorans]
MIVRGIVGHLARLRPDQSDVPSIRADPAEHAGDGASLPPNLNGEVVRRLRA